MVSALQRRALGQAVDDQEFLHAVDLAAAHAHRVDHRHAAGRDIVAVANAARRLPGDLLAKVGAGLLDQPEQCFCVFAQRLGRASKAAARLDMHIVRGRGFVERLGDQPRGDLLVVGRPRAQVDAQDGKVGDDIAWAIRRRSAPG